MSCHGTPGNRLATSLACALASTTSDEVSRRFHALKNEDSAELVEQPTQEEVIEWIDKQETALRAEETLSSYRRDRLQRALTEARADAQEDNLPDGATWHAWREIRAVCDDAHVYAWLAHESGTKLPMAELTPSDIDVQLGGIWEKIYQTQYYLRREREHLDRLNSRYRSREPSQRELDRAAQEIERLEGTLSGLFDQTEPFNAEYRRRQGWSRYYRVVTSGQGHVHRSMDCYTCYPTTKYEWLPSLSGKGQLEAVDDYGSEMCSICFPDVLEHPSYQTRGRIAEATRSVRETERAERQAVRDAKAIRNPDGTQLRLGRGNYPDRIDSVVMAERELVNNLADLRSKYINEEMVADATYYDSLWRNTNVTLTDRIARQMEKKDEAEENVGVLVKALAHKRGTTEEEVLASMEVKVAKKARKQLKDSRQARGEI